MSAYATLASASAVLAALEAITWYSSLAPGFANLTIPTPMTLTRRPIVMLLQNVLRPSSAPAPWSPHPPPSPRSGGRGSACPHVPLPFPPLRGKGVGG